jgi:hypothetical protein
MSGIAAAFEVVAQHNLLPTRQRAVDISSTDYDCTTAFTAAGGMPFARRIYCGVDGGNIKVLMVNDTDAVAREVPAGGYVEGIIATVVKIGTDCTGMIAEQ